MSFEEALRENLPVTAVGDLRLRYDGPMLVGELAPGAAGARLPASLADGLGVAALSAALISVVLLLATPWVGLAAAFALCFAALLYGSAAVRGRQRARRRFVLNFADETLRLERPARGLGAPLTRVVSFDEVLGLVLERRPQGALGLEVEVQREGAEPESFPLVQQAGAGDEDALRSLARMLHHAFGLRGEPDRL